MKHWKTIAPILLLVALAAPAAARGADNRATLAAARSKFTKQDAALNTVYKTVIATLDKTGAAQLRKDESDWLKYRDDLSENAPHFNGHGDPDDPKTTPDYWDMMKSLTEERVGFLRAWTGRDVPPGITGEYSDCHGATLDLEETKSGIKFDLTAVRGPSAHNGEITGVIHPKGDTARFVEQLDTTISPAEPPCELTFTFIGGHIVKVAQKGRDPDAGMGVYYDGAYYKIGKLKKHLDGQ
jgi:uncharacterized protein YecT (DUF1311 family)